MHPVYKRNNIAFTGLLTNKILSRVPGPEFSRLLPHLEPVSISTGEYIYELGQPISYLYFPESVVVSQLYFLEDGGSSGVSIIGSDGFLGLTALLESPKTSYWAIATVGGNALRIRINEFRSEFVNGGPLQKLVLAYANARINQLAQRAVCNSRHRLEERLCSWLLMVDDRAHVAELPLTHEAISQHLGTRRAGVTNFCNVLRDNNVIAYQRGMITILDRATLEEAACECYGKVQ